MSSDIPPNPYFSGINYNPGFFSSITDYLTVAIANSKYLKLLGGTLGGFLGILRTPARVALDVNGKAVLNDGTSGNPTIATLGGAGTKLILKEGGGIDTPIALGTNVNDLWYGVAGGGNHLFYTGTTERMRIENNGSVGIGSTVPTSANTKLTIRGASSGYLEPLVDIIQTAGWNGNYALQVTGYTNLGGIRIYGGDNGNSIYQTLPNKDIEIAQFPAGTNTGNISFTTYGTGRIRFYTSGANEKFRIDENGVVYLYGGNLQLNSVNGNNVAIATGAGSFSTSAATGDMVIRSIQKLILQSGTGKAAMVIGANNNIALGIDTATTYPITIGSSTGGTQTGPLPTYALAGVSIYAGNQTPGLNPFVVLGIMNTTAFAGGFYLYSDERIKKDIKPLENSLDLIEKIKPISFKYIDFVKNGTINNYGVIAQEIEKVIPEVVNSHKDYIPNIFKNADKYDNELLRLYIKTDDISIGDNIKILDIDNKPHYKKIVDKDDDYITIDEPIEKYEADTPIFIYGKEVEDVKNVNYEALFMINIKATQELHQRLKILEDIIKNLIN